MKKLIMSCIGILLFVAGYYQTRRQAAYVAAKAPLSESVYVTTPSSVTTDVKHTFAFRLVKPS